LDERLADAHTVLALVKKDTWDWAGAEQEFTRAIELNPSLARAHSAFSAYLSIMSRHDQAIAEMKRARELDPLSLRYNANIGYAYYWARQYDQAIEQLTRTLELDQNFAPAHGLLGYAFAGKGDYTHAIAEYRESIKLRGENTSDQCYLGVALAKAGQRAEAEAILKQLETTKEYVSPTELAQLYVGLGDKEKALEALERAYMAHDLQLQYLGVEPLYDSLRTDPRFQELIRKVGLPR
jgi:tetratricopeptide (TPR) repeat protein